MEDLKRLFIAIELSADVRQWLREARILLNGRVPSGSVRWTDPNGIHVTLKFLGEIPAARIPEICGVMDRAVEGLRPFPLEAEGLGCFPEADRPRVLWAGVRRQPHLEDLQKRLEDGLERIGFPRERRAFSPHLTLGRVRDGVTGRALADIGRAVASATLNTTAGMEAGEVCLFNSLLRPAGAEYSILYRKAFAAAAAGRSADGRSA